MSKEQGLFWEPKQKVKRKRRGTANVMPRIKSKWRPLKPSNWPNYRYAKKVSIDVETYDPNLLTHGPGYARHDGFLVGISAAVSRSECVYLPMRHEVESNLNCDPDKVLLWAKDNLTTPNQLKIGANILYDIGWLREEGVVVPGPYIDVQHVEALIDEHKRSYNLDSISKKYLKEGKVSSKLYDWLSEYYGGKPSQEQRKNIYRAPVSYVGPYAEADAWQPLKILKKQLKIVKYEKLERVLDLECRLIPLLLDMRFRGVRIDLDKVEELREYLLRKEIKAQEELNKKAGTLVEVNKNKSLEKVFNNNSIAYPTTEKGNSSFTAGFLENHESHIARLVVEVRRMQKLRGTFVEGALLNKHVNGRIHCQFNQLKTDKGGTVSGRFSSSDPNLQNIPSRTEEGKAIRSCFIPDEGFSDWVRTDASQIEYRGLAHYAVGKGSAELRTTYRNNPKTDYHQAIIDLIDKVTGVTLERKPAKNINFGICYGMGVEKLIRTLGLTNKRGKELMIAYHSSAPFVKATFDAAVALVHKQGFITTIMGRRARFPFWEEPYGDRIYMSYNECVANVGHRAQRAFAYKALNSLLQGTAADFMKKLMVDTYESGIFDLMGGVPHITVHDELNMSSNFAKDKETLFEMRRIMEKSIPMRIPLLMDFEVGTNWGNCKEITL